ncbi:hypothetical protein REPUB_Repub09cG0038300 [Reevesia pubescens]
MWYWRNSLLHDRNFVWLANASQLIMEKAKVAWDFIGKFSAKLRYETLVGWSKPDAQYVKINGDGNAMGQSGLATTGGLLRDDGGMWLCGFTYIVGVACVLTSKLWARVDPVLGKRV